MEETRYFPERYVKNIRELMTALGTDEETAFNMMLMTATLMDLNPEDEEVDRMILDDCGKEVA